MKKFILSIIGISIFALLTGCFTGSPIPSTITSNETATENSESLGYIKKYEENNKFLY